MIFVLRETLRKTANALNCDLVYALIPRQPLQMLVRTQAEKIAKQKLQRIAHSMALEDQAVPTVTKNIVKHRSY